MTKQLSLLSDSASASSPAEISRQIRSLLKELPEVRADAARLDALRRLFTQLETDGELSFGTPLPQNAVAVKWQKFLHKSHQTMVRQLCERVQMGRHASIRCLWGVIAGSPTTIRGHANDDKSYKRLNTSLLQEWMNAMIQQETLMDKGMKHMVEAEFLTPFRDVQYYSLGCIVALATAAYGHETTENPRDDDKVEDDDGDEIQSHKERLAQKLLELLMLIPVPASQNEIDHSSQYLFPPPTNISSSNVEAQEEEQNSEKSEEEVSEDEGESSSDDEDSDNDNEDDENDGSTRPSKKQKTEPQFRFVFQRMRTFRREYLRAWLAVLRLPLPITSLKQALLFLPQHVLDYVSHPLRFSDFFMQAYSDHQGVTGVLALDGLFLLITKYDLEYPNFYKQLYKLISSKVLYAKYRTRFFSLLTKCLTRNEMLPAHLVAAFVKRLCRCALCGPVSSVLFVLALVSNLLRKHPECSCLVHRQGSSEMEDLFLPEEDDPVECRALQSSLWELAVLEKHYYPAVGTLAKSIGRPEEDNAPLHVMDDFVSHTYGSLFSQEKKKKTKTALAFQKPESLFTTEDIFAGCLDIARSSSD
ncbi:CBF/Mak21 family-domain containing protein [Nitzschia inconspicua]|uniref:CBF/Mak21 family-domain containing protein n=1 Tax=Nitzschia inconspicua TaxID=303405 RepID=A0A9K3L0C4_9STRA|nr:CBF/Mak21 family-domain containing protein [Nitzschia inconspicua]